MGVVYNPGDTNFNTFLEDYNLQLQQKKRALIFGDFNIDLLKPNNKTKLYQKTLTETGYLILNNIDEHYCTRETSLKKSIIDHVSTNLKLNSFHMAIIDSNISDHKQIFLEIKKYKRPPKKQIKYESIDYTKLKLMFANIQSLLAHDFISLFNFVATCVKHSKIKKTKMLNTPRDDWINKDIIQDIQRRNE